MGHDLWCKDCVRNKINSKEDLIDYCYANKRVFSEVLYDKCEKNVDESLNRDLDYLKISDEDKKKKHRFDLIKKMYLKQMNLKLYYKVAEDRSVDEQISNYLEEQIIQKTFEAAKELVSDEVNNLNFDEIKHYDNVWHGDFSDGEIEFLNNYYANLETQFDITDSHMEDNFREVAKSALEKTLAYNAKRRGEPGASDRYKEAVDIYIKLSNQAKLSNSQRTANDRIGFSDLGTLIKMVEDTGALCRKQEFEKDDVDLILGDFYHAFRSFNPIEINKESEENG